MTRKSLYLGAFLGAIIAIAWRFVTLDGLPTNLSIFHWLFLGIVGALLGAGCGWVIGRILLIRT